MKGRPLRFCCGLPGILSLPFSPNNLWAAGGSEGITGEVFWQFVSFVLLLILLGFILRKPLRAFLIRRREEIEKFLEQAAKKEGESRTQFLEWERKLNSLSQEITELRQKISQERESERQRITERALEEGGRIREQAQVVAEQEVKKARATLKKEMVDLSVELAEKLLKEATQPQDQERLVKEYIGKVGEFR
ncbi:MAG: F0F1 ATP synthase subunit B [Deltaproteobacteria bacterium]|nr:F0F1 ATP synthase subunit B [Deltaproteobacteria bacterium]